jgi:hypothetical protein
MRVLAKALLFGSAAALVLVALVPPGLYWIGISNVEGRPRPPQPAEIQRSDRDFIANLKFPHRVLLRELNPWNYAFLADAQDPAVWIVAGTYNATHLKRRQMYWWQLSGAALMIWISQNWSQDQIISAAAVAAKSEPASNQRLERL